MASILQLLLLPFPRLRLRVAERCHQANPGRDSILSYASALSAVGRNQDALHLLNQARFANPRDGELNRALKRVRGRQANLLLKQAQANHRIRPTVETSIRVAHLLKATGKPQAALRFISPLLETHPHHAALLRTAGTIHLEQYHRSHDESDLTAGIDHLQASLAVEPSDKKALLNLAIARCAAGQLREALPLIGTALALDPGDPRALRLHGYCKKVLRRSRSRLGSALRTTRSRPPLEEEELQPPAEASALLERTFGHESVRAVFAVARDGSVIASRTRPSTLFTFEGQPDALKSLAAASRFDGERIGIGPVHSCIITGDNWQVAVLSQDDTNVIAFCESETAESETECWFDQELTKSADSHA